jgi:hydroxymethylpyrimidine/phosphomethylpyrimidine kinase
MLAGLVALKVKAQESFEEAMKTFLDSENKAVVAKLTGAKSEDLSGEIFDDISAPTALKGKLPNDTACFVLVKKEAPKVLFLMWQPEDVPVKMRMKASTFKASVMDCVKELLPDAELLTANATEEDDLNDEMGNPRKVTMEETQAEAAPKPTGGFKPPVGGYSLPGMGGPPKMG